MTFEELISLYQFSDAKNKFVGKVLFSNKIDIKNRFIYTNLCDEISDYYKTYVLDTVESIIKVLDINDYENKEISTFIDTDDYYSKKKASFNSENRHKKVYEMIKNDELLLLEYLPMSYEKTIDMLKSYNIGFYEIVEDNIILYTYYAKNIVGLIFNKNDIIDYCKNSIFDLCKIDYMQKNIIELKNLSDIYNIESGIYAYHRKYIHKVNEEIYHVLIKYSGDNINDDTSEILESISFDPNEFSSSKDYVVVLTKAQLMSIEPLLHEYSDNIGIITKDYCDYKQKHKILYLANDINYLDRFYNNTRDIYLINIERIPHGKFDSRNIENVVGIDTIYLEDESFNGCAALKSAIFPNVVNIGDHCFEYCRLLEDVDISKCNVLKYRVFNGCRSLRKIDLSAVIEMGANIFNECIKLEDVKIGTGLENMPAYCFSDCFVLKNIDLLNVLTIGHDAFNRCVSLETIKCDNVNEINTRAFYECRSLKYFNASKVTAIKPSAFEGCSLLETVNIFQCKQINKTAFLNCKMLKHVVASNIETIGASAFEGCFSLKEIDLSKVNVIDQSAFITCISLTNIDLSNCTKFGDMVFAACANLEHVKIKKDINVENIKNDVFFKCDRLIKDGAFEYV